MEFLSQTLDALSAAKLGALDMAAIQKSEEWFSQRIGRVTGSRVGAILGDNPYQKPADVLRDMVREYAGAEREFLGNIATEYGNTHEPDARSAYEAETGELVEEVGLIVHPDWGRLAASPDGLVGNDGSVEFKAPYSGIKRKIPVHYWHQMQLVMHCTQRQWCDFLEWSPSETWMQRVFIDDNWLDSVGGILSDFLAEYDAAIASNDAMRTHLEPLVAERKDNDWFEAAQAYIEAKEAADFAAAREEKARQALLAMTDRAAEGAGVKVTPYERAGSIDWGKFAKDNDLLDRAEAYRKKPSQGWRITV